MVSDRLKQIEKKLKLLYEQLDAVENSIIMNPNPMAQEQCRQQIREQIKPEIQKYETEYLQILEQNASEFASSDAQIVIDVIAEEVERVQNSSDSYPQEILEVLQRIEATLNEPGATAAGKLKGTMSLMPPFVNLSYEAELDTENFFRKYFPTFRRLIKGAKK